MKDHLTKAKIEEIKKKHAEKQKAVEDNRIIKK
jgi:hypothetical protein